MNDNNKIQELIDELEEVRNTWRKPWSNKKKIRIYFLLGTVIQALYDSKSQTPR